MSDTSIMSVREIVAETFGEEDINVVNLKLLQALLYLLARQMRMLERQLDIGFLHAPLGSTETFMSVTEVRVSTSVAKKNRKAKRKILKEKESTIITKKPSSTTRNVTSPAKTTDDSAPESGKEKEPSSKDSKDSDDESRALKKSSSHSQKSRFYEYEADVKVNDSSKTELAKTDSKKKGLYEQESAGLLTGKHSPGMTVTGTSSSESSKIKKSDSKDEVMSSETPAASEESFDVYTEKLLIMERLPNEAKQNRTPTTHPRLSLVTEEQFSKLVDQVIELETNIAAISMVNLAGNVKLMEEVGKTASLTDAMAALQLSARVDSMENELKNMIGLLNDLSKRVPPPKKQADEPAPTIQDVGIVKSMGGVHQTQEKQSALNIILDEGIDEKSQKKPSAMTLTDIPLDETHVTAPFKPQAKPLEQSQLADEVIDKPKYNFITPEELDEALKDAYDEFTKAIDITSNKTILNSENAEKICRIVARIIGALRRKSGFYYIAEFIKDINTLETKIATMMIDYQEQLTQLHYDIDIGIENVQETLQVRGGDNEAIADLNVRYNSLQEDFIKNKGKQKNLSDVQIFMKAKLDSLWREIEILRQVKADRDEVAEGLRDKAGIGILNTLVSLSQFDAVRDDLERRLTAAYDKFCNQEVLWQKAIDDLTREINEKAEYHQVLQLKDNVYKNIEMVMERIQFMLNLLGEPRTGAVRRNLYRTAPCLSCANPAKMETPDYKKSSKNRRHRGGMPERGEGDGLCYPDQPIPHKLDPRAGICTKPCGSTVPTKLLKIPASINISTLIRAPGIGPDEKPCTPDQNLVPCVPCHTASLSPVKSGQKVAKLGSMKCEVELR